MTIEKILVVDDEENIRDFLIETLFRLELDVETAHNGQEAINLIKNKSFDLIFCDLKMPDVTGLEVLQKTKAATPETIFIMMTAFGSIESAVEAMRIGAFDYLLKPFTPDTVRAAIERAKEHQALQNENLHLRSELYAREKGIKKEIIYSSPLMQKLFRDAEKIAKSNANVFLSGESGCGKEVMAYFIHYNSLRANNPYIRVNCAALQENLIESEFFGHEKGAFTGAYTKKIGRFELANGGTLLLDEISEIPISLQAKLLRVVQEQEFERVGGTKPIKIDVRIISTSNQNLEKAIANKTFRHDLYYRLNVIPIYIPPLRERKEDIIPLANYFMKVSCSENNKEIKPFSKKAEKALLAYHWPGNIREIANVVERAVVLSEGKVIDVCDLKLDLEKDTEKLKKLKAKTKSNKKITS